ncbi:YbaK/prolyl-tRNA synthetase associated domain-containing protein (fragment) [Paraburkholderia ribeironis]|uniref:YbaK/prolyl-tRNA synthetase associated domain-containing protein n=1 Tax=Paraburkholderia ribeironis TaxID=1247936 RepID=A0A1N7SNA9_9BURK
MLGRDAKVDNRKFKDTFKGKGKMLSSEEVLAWTSHPLSQA